MSSGSKITVTALLLLVLGGLVVTDAWYGGSDLAALVPGGTPVLVEETDGTSSLSASSQAAAVGIAKNSGPTLAQVAASQNVKLTANTKEATLFGDIFADRAKPVSQVILKDGDRAGSVTVVTSPQVKILFVSLKEALLGKFSSRISGLKDETLQENGRPVRNILQFTDPAISEEKIVIVRVRENLYEIRMAKGKEQVMESLMDALTR